MENGELGSVCFGMIPNKEGGWDRMSEEEMFKLFENIDTSALLGTNKKEGEEGKGEMRKGEMRKGEYDWVTEKLVVEEGADGKVIITMWE